MSQYHTLIELIVYKVSLDDLKSLTPVIAGVRFEFDHSTKKMFVDNHGSYSDVPDSR